MLEDKYHEDDDPIRKREREWNRPKPKTPVLHHQKSYGALSGNDSPVSPMNGLHKKGSAGSLRSLDSFSSKTSSPTSPADCKAHQVGYNMDTDWTADQNRERAWNSPVTSRRTSLVLPHRERQRTVSHPSRPTSALSVHSPNGHSAFIHHHSTSRSASPAGSMNSDMSISERTEEFQHEIEHIRERNWGAARPKWTLPDGRPVSPMPPSHSPVHSRSHSSLRVRADSSAKAESSHHHEREEDRSLHQPSTSKAKSSPPLPPADSNGPAHDTSDGPNFGWHMPKHRMPLPPFELDTDSPQRPPPPTERARSPMPATPSHIPVRSHKKVHEPSTNGRSREGEMSRARSDSTDKSYEGGSSDVFGTPSTSINPAVSGTSLLRYSNFLPNSMVRSLTPAASG